MLKAFFLDRDGTINYDVNYLHELQDIHILKGVKQALKLMKQNNYLIIVISNQGAIDKKILSQNKLIKINNKINQLVDNYIDKFYYCQHHPSISGICNCRKPNPHLIDLACKELNINVNQSYMIGDKLSDVETGINANCKESRLISCNKDYELLNITKELLNINEIDN